MTVTAVRKDPVALTMTLTAEFAASPERVWDLWADPRKLERWWGPPTDPATFETHDLTPGGEATYVMSGPDGATRGAWRVTAVDPPTALEFTDAFTDQDGRRIADMPLITIRVRLTEHDRGTRMEMHLTFESREDMEKLMSTGIVEGLRQAEAYPHILVSSSAIGYYGARGEEPLDEDAAAGRDFLAKLCVEWEAEAANASALGVRVVQVRTGVVLDRGGGALAKMLPPFRLGVGGPVAGGRQFISWIHLEDLVGMMLAALADPRWVGPINASAPEPVSNREFSRALGAALHRPSMLPVPGLALRLLYGEMAQIVTTGARVVPAKPLVLGFQFRHPQLEEALRSALASR